MLFYVSFVLGFDGDVLSFALASVRSQRLDLGLKATDFLETQARPAQPNFDNSTGGHTQCNYPSIIILPFFEPRQNTLSGLTISSRTHCGI